MGFCEICERWEYFLQTSFCNTCKKRVCNYCIGRSMASGVGRFARRTIHCTNCTHKH